MRLTGKCKEAFEKWYMNSSSIYFSAGYHEVLSRLYGVSHEGELSVFYHSPESMQYGVYVDWFDSVGINVIGDRSRSILNNTNYFSNVWDVHDGESSPLDFHNTLAEARTAAIEKANEIYNKRL